MAGRGGVSAGAVASALAGSLLIWSGVTGASLTQALRSLLSGQAPAAADVNPLGGGGGGAAGLPSGGGSVTPGSGGITPRQAYQALRAAGIPVSAAITLTAIGGVESGWNTKALNNTPATGDYSVGVWQINYFGSLLAERSPVLGSPQQLTGNLTAQARAVAILYRQSGLQPWMPDITSGKINQFLPQAMAAAGE
jgi:hypothetical protein